MTLSEAGRKGGTRGKGSAKTRPHDFYTKILPEARRRARELRLKKQKPKIRK